MLVINLLSWFRIQKDSGSFTVAFGLNVTEESEAQVESTTPLRWRRASGLWWRHGGREWNQTLTRDLWLHACCSKTFDRVPLSLLSLLDHLICLLLSFFCLHHHLLLLHFSRTLWSWKLTPGSGDWTLSRSQKLRTITVRRLGVVGATVE